MISDKKRLDLFINSINNQAYKEYNQIRRDSDNFVENELNAARKRAKSEAKKIENLKIDKLNEKNNEELSSLKTQKLSELLDLRNKIFCDVFNKVEEELSIFTKKEEYKNFLIKSAQNILSVCDENTTLFIREEDKMHIPELKRFFTSVQIDPSIKLGGLKAKNINSGIFIDDSLDSRLEIEKENFYQTSGLTISL